MQIDQVLQNLGLTDKEPQVFISLLQLPGAQPASLIATRSGINRTTTYKALMSLVKRGLVTKTQRQGITCFFAEDPENRLKTLVEKQKEQLNQMSQVILKSIPLLTMAGNEAYLPKIRYYEGIEGIKQIYEAILREEKDVYRYGDITKIYEALGVFTDEYIKRGINSALKPMRSCRIAPGRVMLKSIAKKRAKLNLFPAKFFRSMVKFVFLETKWPLFHFKKVQPLPFCWRANRSLICFWLFLC
ncbi:hypothetical protein IPJ72_03855 [Candidatus Peregrinibacteria bacterium]|nr:MAG: hypothetical protein IPJ72_03855 [Candidatus Peregrinibacteria bacterium]